MSAPAITTDQLRAVIQLPPRPYSDSYTYDGSPYYDISRREIVAILSLAGTAGGVAKHFVLGVDYQITGGAIDWTIGGTVPDFGTTFTVQYTYSRLSGDAANTAVANASMIVALELGVSFPYGTLTPTGIPFNSISLMLQGYLAAREASQTLIAAEIDTAEKYRRGSVLVDDTKKTADWQAAAADYDAKYRATLILARGPVRGFVTAGAAFDRLVFSPEWNRLCGAREYGAFAVGGEW